MAAGAEDGSLRKSEWHQEARSTEATNVIIGGQLSKEIDSLSFEGIAHPRYSIIRTDFRGPPQLFGRMTHFNEPLSVRKGAVCAGCY